MNYLKIHDLIINRAKSRNTTGYTENHHITPKCLGGSNKKENLVKLTAKEHFLIHRLLIEIYPNNKSLIYAYWAMCGFKGNGYYLGNRHLISARTYEYAKKLMSVATKERLKENNIWIDKKHTEETKIKQSESAKIRNISIENEILRREGISKTMKLVKRTEEWNANVSKAKIGDKNPMFGLIGCDNPKSKPVLQYDLNNIFIREWCNTREASDELNIGYKAINLCLTEKTKTSGGFIWKYKNQ